jgi:nucleotide-binding universal stress UspA family protein
MQITSVSENCILVPLNFSEQSLIALGQSYNLAKLTKSKLVLLHILTDKSDPDVKNILQLRAEKVRLEAGVPVEIMIENGNVFKKILDVSKKTNPLFIVMGFTSNLGFDKIVGYNTFRLVRESNFPIMTIRGKQHNNGCKNILLPLDLTKETREKVGKAIQIAKMFGSTIKVLSVFSSKQRRLENKLISYSHQVRNFIKEKGIPCTIKTIEGDNICGVVLNYAAKNDVDLIMIMTKEELSLKEIFIGTTAQKLLNLSTIPVMSIRPKERKDTTAFASPY